MIRSINIFLLVVSAVALVGVYTLKFRAEGTEAVKIGLERQIVEQQADLRLLKADWAVVNQPNKIEPLIKRHNDVLKLAIVGANQFKNFDDLPMRPAKLDADELTAFLRSLENGIDPIAALIEAN